MRERKRRRKGEERRGEESRGEERSNDDMAHISGIRHQTVPPINRTRRQVRRKEERKETY